MGSAPKSTAEWVEISPSAPLGPYIADFFCPEYRLVIELDGTSHADKAEDDETRTSELINHGYRVLRFRNEEVQTNLPQVLSTILSASSNSQHQ